MGYAQHVASITRRQSTGRDRREAVEEQVFAAVERLLDTGVSYTELGVQRIAEEAGIARSTFYVHFSDKTDLLMRLTEAATSGLFAVAERWAYGDHGWRVDGIVRTHAEMIAHYRAHTGTLIALHEVASYEPAVDAYWRERINRFVAILAAHLERGKPSGRVPAELDSETTARIATWSVERIVARHVIDDDGSGDERLAAALGRSTWLMLYGTLPPEAV